MKQTTLFGEYYFRKHEMVAGFNFSRDGKFQFFFIYGAVDRNATGTFSVDGDVVKLKSDKEPGRDFIPQKQSRHHNGGYHIAIKAPNPYLVENVRCLYFVGDKQHEEWSDSRGEIKIPVQECEKIYLQHALYPDVASLIKDADNDNNYFELELNPSLEQVSFKGIDLHIEGDALTCLPNYFLPMEGIVFEKE